MDYFKESVKLHKKLKGKLSVNSRIKLNNKRAMSLAYTPGVAEPCKEIAKHPEMVYDYTIKNNSVAVVTDGSAVLGLGNLGAAAALPVMEGKAAIFKEFAGVDAFPIGIDSQKPDDIIKAVKLIAPVFGGINLEDISSPRCFEIENALQDIGIPVFHDDQDGTTIVTLAAMINACKITGKKFNELKVVIIGAGAAGIALSETLLNIDIYLPEIKVDDLVLIDSKGPLYRGRKNINNHYKAEIANKSNKDMAKTTEEAFVDADVFIGVSVPGIVTKKMVKLMAKNAIVFAMANPVPEISPKDAKAAGAVVIGTGRSDYPNQINNALVFPGVFRGVLDARAEKIMPSMKIAAAYALAGCVKKPSPKRVLPYVLEKIVVKEVAKAVKSGAVKYGVAKKK